MSPKKQKKSGQKKKKESKKEVNKLSELDKEVYLVQIKDLEDRLQRLQKLCRELELRCGSYKTHSEQMAADKYDTVEYLKQALDVRNNELDELQERLRGLQKARDVDAAAHEQLVSQLKVKYQETKDQLTSENIVLDGKLASLEEFRAQKEKTLAQIEELQKRLKCQDDEHCEAMRNADKKAALDQEQLKREMAQHLEDMAAKFREMSNQQMADTTRRVISENASLAAQIDRLHGKMAAVMADNQCLIEQKEKQLLRIDVLESMERDLVRRNVALAKTLDCQSSRIKENDHKVVQLEPLLARNRTLEDDLRRVTTELKNLKEEASGKRKSNEALTSTLSELAKKLESEQMDRTLMQAVLHNAAIALRDGIKVNNASEREATLGSLLEILNAASATKQLPVPFFTDTIVNRRPSSGEQYLRGDIGIVQRLTSRRVRGRTIATQTEQFDVWSSSSTVAFPPLVVADDNGFRKQQRRSAAYRILHDIGSLGTTFEDRFGDPMPRSRAFTARLFPPRN